MLNIQSIYSFIYNSSINFLLRNINYGFNKIFKTPIKLPPSGVLKVRTDSGAITMHTNQTSYLTQLLFWNGYKSFEYSEIFETLVKNTPVFLDIGSNIGYYSLLASKANPEISIYAFEPALGPKHFLKKNIEANNFERNIQMIDQALSNADGVIDFYEVANKKYRNLKYNLAGEGNAGTKTEGRPYVKNRVHAITLEHFINDHNIKQIDLIKIDTEGTEIDILKSGKHLINAYQPIVICETLYQTIEDDLDRYFSDLNYEFYQHTAGGLKQTHTLHRDVDDGIRNCFFVPPSKRHLIANFILEE